MKSVVCWLRLTRVLAVAAAWLCWPCVGLAELVVGTFGSAGPLGHAPCSAGSTRVWMGPPSTAVVLLAKQTKLYTIYRFFRFHFVQWVVSLVVWVFGFSLYNPKVVVWELYLIFMM